MLRLPNVVASVASEMQPKLHFLRTPHPRQRISHAMCSFLKCSLSCISYVHRIRASGFLMRCASLQLLPNHSDEFVQDLHLFPFYPVHTAHISHAKRLYMTGTNDLLYETFYILSYCAFIYNAKIASDFRRLQ